MNSEKEIVRNALAKISMQTIWKHFHQIDTFSSYWKRIQKKRNTKHRVIKKIPFMVDKKCLEPESSLYAELNDSRNQQMFKVDVL